MVKKDGEYSGAEDSEDDEETIAQEEKTSKRLDYKEEITDLEKEGKIGGCKFGPDIFFRSILDTIFK